MFSSNTPKNSELTSSCSPSTFNVSIAKNFLTPSQSICLTPALEANLNNCFHCICSSFLSSFSDPVTILKFSKPSGLKRWCSEESLLSWELILQLFTVPRILLETAEDSFVFVRPTLLRILGLSESVTIQNELTSSSYVESFSIDKHRDLEAKRLKIDKQEFGIIAVELQYSNTTATATTPEISDPVYMLPPTKDISQSRINPDFSFKGQEIKDIEMHDISKIGIMEVEKDVKVKDFPVITRTYELKHAKIENVVTKESTVKESEIQRLEDGELSDEELFDDFQPQKKNNQDVYLTRMLSTTSTDQSFVDRLTSFVSLHYPDSPSPTYTNIQVAPDKFRGKVLIPGIDQLVESSRNFDSEAKAAEDVARLACQFMFAYHTAAINTEKLTGKLSNLFSKNLDSAETTEEAIMPKIGIQSHVHALVAWGMREKHAIDFVFEKADAQDHHKAQINIKGVVYESTRLFKRKQDAKEEVAKMACEVLGIQPKEVMISKLQKKVPTSILNEILQRRKIKAEWESLQCKDCNNNIQYLAKVKVLQQEICGTVWQLSKSDSRNDVALLAIEFLNSGIAPPPPDPKLFEPMNQQIQQQKRMSNVSLRYNQQMFPNQMTFAPYGYPVWPMGPVVGMPMPGSVPPYVNFNRGRGRGEQKGYKKF
ncbi:hypothetical protein HK096_005179 [Nowakowskiella sp. JEL0078]|nr:hypothetical protein HK096_005179 [Nowakowskiella sp. JEL0078]